MSSRLPRFLLRDANQNETAFTIGSAAPFHTLRPSNLRVGVGCVICDGLNVFPF